MQSNNFIEQFKSKLESEGITYDFNFSYINTHPSGYLIVKRSMDNPLESFPILSVQFLGGKREYIKQENTMAKLCEILTNDEYNYQKEKKKNA